MIVRMVMQTDFEHVVVPVEKVMLEIAKKFIEQYEKEPERKVN